MIVFLFKGPKAMPRTKIATAFDEIQQMLSEVQATISPHS
jgi:hypothetical protein